MEEYTIGSIADLITGKQTPNKQKVFKRTIGQVSAADESTTPEVKKPKFLKSKNKKSRISPADKNVPETKKKFKPKNQKGKKKNRVNLNHTSSDNLVVIDHEQLMPKAKAVEADDSSDDDEEPLETPENDFFIPENDPAEDSDSSVEESSKLAKKDKNKKGGDTSLPAKPKVTVDQKEINSRTLFVGNVDIHATKNQLKRFFGKYGVVETVRMRCIAPLKQGMSKRDAAHEKKMHQDRGTLTVYVLFKKRDDAVKAESELNGFTYKGHHLRTQMCDRDDKRPPNKAIFIGNLPYKCEDDDLWKAFESCGHIHSVRVVRNADYGIGIGIGYVNFESADSVELALNMGEVKIGGKVIRIARYENKKGKGKKDAEQGKNNNRGRKFKNIRREKGVEVTVKKKVFKGKEAGSIKKKKNLNKDFLKKLKLSRKIAPRS